MKTVFYIHGANCTSNSFAFIRANLPKHTAHYVSYDSYTKLEDIFDSTWASLPENTPITMIGHSLGGILSVLASQKAVLHRMTSKQVLIDQIVTIGSPFGGAEGANLLRFVYPEYKILAGIHTRSDFIKQLVETGAVVPTLSFVSTAGSTPFLGGKNDGIVTVKSQRSLPNAVYEEIQLNHFETLLSKEIVKKISKFAFS